MSLGGAAAHSHRKIKDRNSEKNTDIDEIEQENDKQNVMKLSKNDDSDNNTDHYSSKSNNDNITDFYDDSSVSKPVGTSCYKRCGER